MAQQNSKPFKILVPKVRQSLYVDTVVNERLRVLAEAKSVEPLRDVFGHLAASTRSRFWPKSTVGGRSCPSRPNVGLGHERKSSVSLKMSLVGGKADFDFKRLDVAL
jgi:hypothetical protein